MNVTVDLMNATTTENIPLREDFQCWAQAVMDALNTKHDSELSIRIVDEDESAYLNENFRQHQGPTNILSFPGHQIADTDFTLLGDIAICAQVVLREAEQQNKPSQAHWAHMTVHGVLHLNAYDHENQQDAETMEQLEISILHTLGFTNPYH